MKRCAIALLGGARELEVRPAVTRDDEQRAARDRRDGDAGDDERPRGRGSPGGRWRCGRHLAHVPAERQRRLDGEAPLVGEEAAVGREGGVAHGRQVVAVLRPRCAPAEDEAVAQHQRAPVLVQRGLAVAELLGVGTALS